MYGEYLHHVMHDTIPTLPSRHSEECEETLPEAREICMLGEEAIMIVSTSGRYFVESKEVHPEDREDEEDKH